MSDHLAIAAITTTLRQILQADADTTLPGARVSTVRPNAPGTELPSPGINVFLYQVTPNVAGRNGDLPTRSADGQLVRRPSAALELHYLLSFHGDDSRLEPQVLLASAARTLHARPVLDRAAIQQAVGDAAFAFVAGSDLAEATDLVRLTPAALSLEEMSKLWSVFFQTPYVLSTAYQASAVFIDSPVPTRAPALPVRTIAVRAAPLRRPTIERILSRAADDQPLLERRPILAGHTLALLGRDLRGDRTVVTIDGDAATPVSATAAEVLVRLPERLAAGMHAVRVVHEAAFDGASRPRVVAESSPAPFELRPTIDLSIVRVAAGAAARVRFTPKVAKTQRVVVLLNEVGAPEGRAPRAYRIEAPARRGDPRAPDEVDALDVVLEGVAAGSYLVRAQVDGAESPLGFNPTTGRFDAPRVTVP